MDAPEKLMDAGNTLMISRKPSTLRRAVKIRFVEHDEMAKAGSHGELMGRNGGHARVVQLQRMWEHRVGYRLWLRSGD